jgi:DNA-binding XRE family transcriptional regulator
VQDAAKLWLVEKLPPNPRVVKMPHHRSEYLGPLQIGEHELGATSMGLQTSSRWQKNLRQLRQRAGLTEQALAHRLGVSYHAVQAWEKGQRGVRKEWVSRLAAALDCEIAELRE